MTWFIEFRDDVGYPGLARRPDRQRMLVDGGRRGAADIAQAKELSLSG
jgi:hypothetical protein